MARWNGSISGWLMSEKISGKRITRNPTLGLVRERKTDKTVSMGKMRQFGAVIAASLVAGCAMPSWLQTAPAPTVAMPGETTEALPKPDAPPPTARTVEQFDTTTAEERAEVVEAAAPASRDTPLGTTVASLGDPADPGFWLKTPLVDTERPGRVEYAAAGTSVAVTLIPIEGPKTGGSRLSLPAMRVLEAPLTGLPEIMVFAR